MLSTDVNSNVNVLLPRVWDQEIKRTPVMYFTHAHKISFYLQIMHCNIYKMYNNSSQNQLFRYHEVGSKKLNACIPFFLCMVYF